MTARARLFAAFGAYLCLATHLMGVLHVLVVRHATCPDHGEVVHGEEPVPAETSTLPGQAARDATRDPDEEADDHCLLMATRRREVAPPPPGHQLILFSPVISTLETSAAAAAAPAGALLRFAPKTSPPAVT